MKFLCWLTDITLGLVYFHKFILIETYDEHTRKLQCIRCKKYFAMSDIHKAVLPWDDEYEKITCDIYQISRTKI